MVANLVLEQLAEARIALPKDRTQLAQQLAVIRSSLLQVKSFVEAEPLLVAGYEWLKQREKTIPPQGGIRISEALDRLIDLYTATNKPDEAAKWRPERAKQLDVAPMPREKK